MRVVLDTNIYISALLKREGVCGLVLTAWKNSEFLLLYSEELILELKAVVQYKRLKPRLKRAEIGALIRQIRLLGAQVKGNQNKSESPDPKDNFLIAICEFGKADALVSRDVLGVLEVGMGRTVVMTPEVFLQILSTNPKER
jgi:uncharacterized protein